MLEVKVMFVGCGKIANSMIEGLIGQGLKPQNIVVIAPNSKPIIEKYQLKRYETPENITFDGVIIFAVKPPVLREILGQYAKYAGNCLFNSVATGISLDLMRQKLGNEAKVSRAMPNTAAEVKHSITGLASTNMSASDKKIIDELFKALGYTYWMEDDSRFHEFLALAASSPAYIYNFLSGMVEAGVQAGFPREEAFEIVKHVLMGSSKIIEAGYNFEDAKNKITTKGGTTEAALTKFNETDKLFNLIKTAIDAAANRSRELS